MLRSQTNMGSAFDQRGQRVGAQVNIAGMGPFERSFDQRGQKVRVSVGHSDSGSGLSNPFNAQAMTDNEIREVYIQILTAKTALIGYHVPVLVEAYSRGIYTPEQLDHACAENVRRLTLSMEGYDYFGGRAEKRGDRPTFAVVDNHGQGCFPKELSDFIDGVTAAATLGKRVLLTKSPGCIEPSDGRVVIYTPLGKDELITLRAELEGISEARGFENPFSYQP